MTGLFLLSKSYGRRNQGSSVRRSFRVLYYCTRKVKAPLKPADAREIVRNYLAWPVQVNDPEMTIQASEIEEKNGISFGTR